MSDNMKKGTILSLSLLLTSTLSVSTAIPAMTEFYAGRSIMEVEQLMSLPAIAIMLVIMLHPIISRWISQDASIITGLLLLSISGIMPVLCQDYDLVFISRMIHGAGIGLINVYAVTIINDLFDGNERAAMLGYRGAAEILGNIICTAIVGQLLSLGINWRYTFLIYVSSTPILILYLVFIKSTKGAATERPHSPEGSEPSGEASSGMGRGYVTAAVFYAICGAIFVGMSCCNTIRIPSLVLEKGLGAEAESSLISSLRLGAGFLSGISFWRFERLLGSRLQPVFFLALGLGELMMAFSSSLPVLLIGSLISGAALSILTTSVFQRSAEWFPPALSDKATTAILVGCNLGSGLASHILYLIDQINGRMYMSFLVFGIAFLPLGLLTLLPGRRKD